MADWIPPPDWIPPNPAPDYAAMQREEIKRAMKNQGWSTCAPSTVMYSHNVTYAHYADSYVSTRDGLAPFSVVPVRREYPVEPKPDGFIKRAWRAWRAYEDWIAKETAKHNEKRAA